jgi:AcrR family transcriptional regulator
MVTFAARREDDSQESTRGNRRPSLLAAARRLFFKRGYYGTTVEQVARAAGFSKRTVYLYFKNKDELFLTVGEEGLVLLREGLEEIPVDQMGVEESIGAILDIYLGFARENPRYFRIIFQEATGDMIRRIPEELRHRLEEHERACLGVVVAVAEKAIAQGKIVGLDPWEVAASFWGAVTGIVLLSLGGSQTVFTRRSREELVAKAVWLLYAGMRRTGEGREDS